MHPIQRRRLNDLENGSLIKEGETAAQLREELDTLQDAITAGQSLDDLGDVESNTHAMKSVDILIDRYRAVSARLAALESNDQEKK